MGMHHGQDIRYMGGLRKRMPITWITFLLGSLALIGTPLFSGFYSKDAIILAIEHSTLFGSGFAYFALILGVFFTALYSFRLYFLVFHGTPRYTVDHSLGEHDHKDGYLAHEPKESTWVITVPLILLAIPSVVIGIFTAKGMMTGSFLKESLFIRSDHNAMADVGEAFHGAWQMALHGFISLPVWLATAGVVLAWFIYLKKPMFEAVYTKALEKLGIMKLVEHKYYFDDFNQKVIANGAVSIGKRLWKYVDDLVIDQGIVYGSAALMQRLGGLFRRLQTGHLYQSSFLMAIGVVALMTFVIIFY